MTSDAHPLEPLLLDQVDARQRGRAHGEHWRASVQALARARLELTRVHGPFGSEEQILEVAGACLDALEDRLPAQAQELRGIAEGADLCPRRITALNLFPDLVQDTVVAGGTMLYLCAEQGPVVGLTWDLPAGSEDHLRMLRLAPAGSDHEVLCLTLTGSLGAAGLSSRGVAVATTALSSRDGGGAAPCWPALVRALLGEPHARAAQARLMATPLAGGRYFLLADGHDYYGVEHGGPGAVLTQLGPRAAHLHTNHYFDPVLRRRERIHPGRNSSIHRLNLATTLFAQQRPRTAEALWSLLHTRDGSPGCPIVDSTPQLEPAAPVTCATMVIRLHEGWVRVVRGGEHRHRPLELRVDRSVAPPVPS